MEIGPNRGVVGLPSPAQPGRSGAGVNRGPETRDVPPAENRSSPVPRSPQSPEAADEARREGAARTPADTVDAVRAMEAASLTVRSGDAESAQAGERARVVVDDGDAGGRAASGSRAMQAFAEVDAMSDVEWLRQGGRLDLFA